MRSLALSAAKDNSEFNEPLRALLGVSPAIDEVERFVRNHFVYQSESYEIVRTPQWMMGELLAQGWFSGDCDDAATFTAAILAAYGYGGKLLAIRYSHPSEFEHVFVESSDRVVIDPTVPRGTIHKELERMTLEF